jgi:Co/Zn/Cd efflux system component
MSKDTRLVFVLLANVAMVVVLVVVGLASHSLGLAGGGDANVMILLVVTVVMIVEALRRLVGGAVHVEGLPVIVVSLVAGVVGDVRVRHRVRRERRIRRASTAKGVA